VTHNPVPGCFCGRLPHTALSYRESASVRPLPWFDLGATSACVGSGVIGGVFTPTIFAGSALGLLYGSFVHSLVSHAAPTIGYVVLGIACLLASVTHAPLMAALMTVELTGTSHWFPVVFFCSLVSVRFAMTISPDSLYTVATPDPGRMAKVYGA
jgi:chloride channel protein, CIC family